MIGLEFLRIIIMLDIIYRLCENETDGNLRDIRPEWFNKISCLQSFLNSVQFAEQLVNSVTFVHDGNEGPLLDYINQSGWGHRVIKVQHKDNLKSLISTFDIADDFDNDI